MQKADRKEARSSPEKGYHEDVGDQKDREYGMEDPHGTVLPGCFLRDFFHEGQHEECTDHVGRPDPYKKHRFGAGGFLGYAEHSHQRKECCHQKQ